jgi:type I restriction enzyme M protein
MGGWKATSRARKVKGVLRRFDAVLEPTKKNVLEMKAFLDAHGVVDQDQPLRSAAGQAVYNTSKFTLRDLQSRTSQQQLRLDFEAYLDGFSPNAQEILDAFELRNEVTKLSRADALGSLIEKFLDPSINLSPQPVLNGDAAHLRPPMETPRRPTQPNRQPARRTLYYRGSGAVDATCG